MKYLSINLKKDLYVENYKILVKETKDRKQMKRYTIFTDWKFQYC